jgi:hypothetical protein
MYSQEFRGCRRCLVCKLKLAILQDKRTLLEIIQSLTDFNKDMDGYEPLAKLFRSISGYSGSQHIYMPLGIQIDSNHKLAITGAFETFKRKDHIATDAELTNLFNEDVQIDRYKGQAAIPQELADRMLFILDDATEIIVIRPAWSHSFGEGPLPAMFEEILERQCVGFPD